MIFINLHTHSYSNDASVLEVVNQYPWEFNPEISQYSIGIHPWHIDETRLTSDLKYIEEKLQLKECCLYNKTSSWKMKNEIFWCGLYCAIYFCILLNKSI